MENSPSNVSSNPYIALIHLARQASPLALDASPAAVAKLFTDVIVMHFLPSSVYSGTFETSESDLTSIV